jgi:hypothetical protein
MYLACAALTLGLASDDVDAGVGPLSPNHMTISETVSQSGIVVEGTVESVTTGHWFGPVDRHVAELALLRVDEAFKGEVERGRAWIWLLDGMGLEAGQRVTFFGGPKVGDRGFSLHPDAHPKAPPLDDTLVPLFQNAVVAGPKPSGRPSASTYCYSGQDRWRYVAGATGDPCTAEDHEGLRRHLRALGRSPQPATPPQTLPGVVP